MKTLSQRERRLVSLLVLAGLMALVWIVLIAPLLNGFSERAIRRNSLLLQYQTNQRIVGSIPRLRRQAERQRDVYSSFAVSAPSLGAVSTVIQERLQNTVDGAGGELRGVEEVATADQQVRLRASARMTLAQLSAVLARLQNETPFVVVETLNIAADQAAISGRLEIMEVSFEVSVPVIVAKSR